MDSLTQRLKALSSAEDFMAFFGIPYEERVVQINRLHILKRFYQYLRKSTDLATGDDIELFRQYRVLLQRAYGDFVQSNAATEKVFKVFQDVNGQQTVTASSLRASLNDRRRPAEGGSQMAASAATPPQQV